jgi:ATP-binding cassette subfamily B protein/subfamily B ATP-binding cassette protein MsbA
VTSDCGCVRQLVIDVVLPLFTSLASLAAMFTIMWRLDRSLSLFALLVVPPLAFCFKRFKGPMTENSYQESRVQGEMMTMAERTLSALPVVQAYGREPDGDRMFSDLTRRAGKASLRTLSSQLRFQVSTNAVTSLGTAAVMMVGAFHVLNGKLSLGSLLVFLSYLQSLYSPLETLAYLNTSLASAAAGARRVFEVLHAEEGTVRDIPGAQPAPRVPEGQRGCLRLDNVTFGYESDRPVLHGVTIDARPGETIALVGPTGAGKSTLVSLIPRLFDPWQGRVLLHGVDIRTIQLASLRSQVALMLQEPFLLPLTVAENIAYGRRNASREEIIAAAVAANADDFIQRLPDGYETVIGERGATLSGGERQRLAIARALLKDAPILILDEPTSALDAETESSLMEALERLMRGRTTFIIAHRLSTVRRADRIVVLDEGRVVEVGTHLELLAARGRYYKFHSLQGSRYLEGVSV